MRCWSVRVVFRNNSKSDWRMVSAPILARTVSTGGLAGLAAWGSGAAASAASAGSAVSVASLAWGFGAAASVVSVTAGFWASGAGVWAARTRVAVEKITLRNMGFLVQLVGGQLRRPPWSRRSREMKML